MLFQTIFNFSASFKSISFFLVLFAWSAISAMQPLIGLGRCTGISMTPRRFRRLSIVFQFLPRFSSAPSRTMTTALVRSERPTSCSERVYSYYKPVFTCIYVIAFLVHLQNTSQICCIAPGFLSWLVFVCMSRWSSCQKRKRVARKRTEAPAECVRVSRLWMT